MQFLDTEITPQLRILVAIEAIDARKGIDSLAQIRNGLARQTMLELTTFRFSYLLQSF